MAQVLSTLPLGAKLEIQVKTEWQHKLGARITFLVVDKNHAGYPSGAVSLMAEKALFSSAYDAKEPTNPNADRASGGNSRYLHSNIHQWMNSASAAWYAAQHPYDAPPTGDNVVNRLNPYAGWPGFLTMVNEQFGITLMNTSLKAARAQVDGGGVDTFTAKMFLPSAFEMGYSETFIQNDGAPLAYFVGGEKRATAIPEAGESGYVRYYVRSAYDADSPLGVDNRGAPYDTFGGHMAYGLSFIRPMGNLPGTAMVMPSPTTPGAFILVENPPTAPTINTPVDSKTVYNRRPRVLITLNAASASGLTQQVLCAGYAAATPYGKQGDKIRLQKTEDAAPGNNSVTVQTKSQYSEFSAPVTRAYKYAAPNFTDTPIQKGSTKIKAVHMNELRAMVNNVRAYYGLPAVQWAEEVEANTTSTRNWGAHVLELRTAIDAVAALVNGWDASTLYRINLPPWLPIGAGRPRADVMEQLRESIQML